MEDMEIDDMEIENSLVSSRDPEDAIKQYLAIIDQKDATSESLKRREQAIYQLSELYVKLGRAKGVQDLLTNIRPFFSVIPKAKTAKIVRTLIDLVGRIPNALQLQAQLCKECIAWCKQEKRTFLRLRVQARLADLHLQMKQYKEAIRLTTRLLYDVKKIDDKLLLVDIQLIESRVHHALQNIPKSKGALTAARSAANSIYCPPLLQAQIDMQGGIICGEEKDYRTGFSYFYEAFEGYNTVGKTEEAMRGLKYMLLSKLMTDNYAEVYLIINSKAGLKYASPQIEAMKAIADSYKERSIHKFQDVLKQYKQYLVDDPIVHSHLSALYENLLEQNYIRILEPYSTVEIDHVAKLINLPVNQVETKLSEMVLDKKISGTLDQGTGTLILFDEVQPDETFEASLNTIKELSNAVDKLSVKAKKAQ